MKLEGRPSVEEASARRRLQTRRRCLRVDRHGKSALTFNLWRSAKICLVNRGRPVAADRTEGAEAPLHAGRRSTLSVNVDDTVAAKQLVLI